MKNKKPPLFKSNYRLENVDNNYGIYEGDMLVLELNDYVNAECILRVLRHDEKKIRNQKAILFLAE